MDTTSGTELNTSAGQPAADPTGATASGPTASATEQASTPSSTPPSQSSEDNFHDLSQYSPEVITAIESAHKNMLADYTRKTQAVASERKQYEQLKGIVDAYNRDPVAFLTNLAQQQGYALTPAQAAQVAAQQQAQAQGDWQPSTWDEVLAKATEAAEAKLAAKYAPIEQMYRQNTAKDIETRLNAIDPEWKTYESQMEATLQKHPSLSGDLEALYELSVPKAVREARATQAAIAKMRNAARLNTAETKSTKTNAAPAPTGKISLEESFARAMAAARG